VRRLDLPYATEAPLLGGGFARLLRLRASAASLAAIRERRSVAVSTPPFSAGRRVMPSFLREG